MAIDSCDHDEDGILVYDTQRNRRCPMCEKNENIEDLEQQIETANEEIGSLKDELESK